MASIHRKSKNGTWYITYREHGRQKHRSLGTRSLRKAQSLKREIEQLIEEAGRAELVVTERPPARRKNPTVSEFWESFLPWAEAHRSPSTVEEYQNWFTQFREFKGIQRLGDATRQDVEQFKARLRRQGKRKPRGVGLDKVSVNNALKTLKSIWNHARKLDLYSGENPFVGVEAFRIAQRIDRGYLDSDEVNKLHEAAVRYADEKYVREAEARNVRIAIALMALAGLRKKEVCFARWEWVRWEERVLVVSSHEEFTTKNKRTRIISMHDELVRILESYRKDDGYILEPLRANEGKSKYRADFKKSFNRVCELAGTTATPHDLRHSFASRHAVRGRSLHVIAGWLGHSTTWVTERYAHCQKQYNADVNDI